MKGDLLDTSGMFPDEGQLDRIEAKLDWLRWRMRWGEQRAAQTADEHALAQGQFVTFVADIGPDPGWPTKDKDKA